MNKKTTIATISSDQHQTLHHRIQYALDYAKKLGGTAAEVDMQVSVGLSVNVRMGEVDTLEFHREKNFAITVYKDHAKGSATTTDLTEAALNSAIEAAFEIAKVTSPDPWAGLADAALMAKNYPDLDLCHPWGIAVEEAIEQAKQCEAIGRNFDKRITNSEGSSISSVESLVAYGNTHGFIGIYPATSHYISCQLLAQEKNSMQRDYYYTSSRDAQNLLPLKQVAEKAAQRTIARLHARTLPTQKASVLFVPETAKGLLGSLISAISGGNLYRKSTFLLDHLNQLVLPKFISIKESPHILKAPGSAPFDNDGVATREQFFVKDGELVSYSLGSYSARRLGLQSTANAGGVHNLSITTSDLDFDGMINKMQRGLVVTELMGQGVNIMTGDYSRGAAGFWVENGAIQFPVEGITIAGNLKDMLQQIVAVGNDVDLRSNIRTGSILIEEMMIAGH